MTRKESLKYLIELSGLTQKKFAEKHELRPERISEWVTGKKNVYLPTLQEIARVEGYKLNINFELEQL